MSEKYIALIPCSGSGSRFGGTVPKQYIPVYGKPVLEHTLKAFIATPLISEIVVVADAADNNVDTFAGLSPRIRIAKVGSYTRSRSVLNGLNSLSCAADDWVLVHDAARCCITPHLIQRLIDELGNDRVGGILAVPVADTLKSGRDGIIMNTLKREGVYMAQTPQMFRYAVLKQALESADLDLVTDEAGSVEQSNNPVRLIAGDVSNIKLTYADDLRLVQAFLKV